MVNQSINTDRRTSNSNEPQQMYQLFDTEVSLLDSTGTLITLEYLVLALLVP